MDHDELKSELKSIKNHLGDINDHLKTLNGQVEKNSNYRVKHEIVIDNLINDREDKFRKYSDLLWKIAIIALAGFFGFNTLL